MHARVIYQSLVAAGIFLLLGGCSKSSGDPNLTPPNPPDSGAIDEITSENAQLLTRSSLDLISKLVTLGNIGVAMVKDSVDMLNSPGLASGQSYIDIPECAAGGYGFETNRIMYMHFDTGFRLPPGDALHVGFSNCALEGVLVDDTFIDIAGLEISGDPTTSGNWSIEAVISLSPARIINSNSTHTSITDTMAMTVTRSNGVVTMTLAVGADADTGQIGGLNAQQFLMPQVSGARPVNYQLRPFYIRVIDDSNTQVYSLAVLAHPTEGGSTLNRYMSNPNSEIRLRIETNSSPVLWNTGRPDDYTDTPASGAVRLTEIDCTGCGNILATVQDDGVALTINDGAAVTTQFSDWSTLLSAPDINVDP
jgi:hypothetical protein